MWGYFWYNVQCYCWERLRKIVAETARKPDKPSGTPFGQTQMRVGQRRGWNNKEAWILNANRNLFELSDFDFD
jgi:hypothetical protein